MTRRRVVFTAFSVDLASSAAEAFAAGALEGALVASPDFPSDISGIGPFNYGIRILKNIKATRSRSKNIGLYAVGISVSSGYERFDDEYFRFFCARMALGTASTDALFRLRHYGGDAVAFSHGAKNQIRQRPD